MEVSSGVYRPSDATFYLKRTNESGVADVAITYGIPGDRPITGDWDGDGVDTVGVYRDGVFYLRNSNMSGFADVVVPFGVPDDTPVAGDWDGDGIDTIGVYRNGVFFLRNANTPGPADLVFAFGLPGDTPIARDWTGKGYDSVGVYRPVESTSSCFFVQNTDANNDTVAGVPLCPGIPSGPAVVGDWDNDGKDVVGIYRDNEFFVPVEYTDHYFRLGIVGDVPLAGNWGLGHGGDGEAQAGGDLLWANQAGGTGDCEVEARGIAVDAAGDSLVTGFFTGSVAFGTGEPNETVIDALGMYDMFIAKYTRHGSLLWAKRAGSSVPAAGTYADASGIAVDAAGNSLVAGSFSGSATFGAGGSNETVLRAVGPSDLFVAKYAP